MTRSGIFPLLLLPAFLMAGLAGCGNSGQASTVKSPDTSVATGTPDNNSANNPSLADTGYEKNRTKPITDTVKRDTTHRSGR